MVKSILYEGTIALNNSVMTIDLQRPHRCRFLANKVENIDYT